VSRLCGSADGNPVVRLEGHPCRNCKKRSIKSSGLNVVSADDLDEAPQKIVRATRKEAAYGYLTQQHQGICPGFNGQFLKRLFHSEQAVLYGTRMVGGTSPGRRANTKHLDVPVFDTVAGARDKTGADASVS